MAERFTAFTDARSFPSWSAAASTIAWLPNSASGALQFRIAAEWFATLSSG